MERGFGGGMAERFECFLVGKKGEKAR